MIARSEQPVPFSQHPIVMRGALAVLTVLVLAMAACGGAPVATVGVPSVLTPQAGFAPSAPRIRPTGAPVTAADRPRLIALARAAIERAVDEPERDELLSLLQAANDIRNDEQSYFAFLGTWQYMRLVFLRNGQSASHRATLEALEAIALTFQQYRPEQFEPQKTG